MRASVVSVVVAYQKSFEGSCSFMYLDVEGLVTTAIGLMVDASAVEGVDPAGPALGLPWNIGGYAATQDEIRTAWHQVKGRQDLRMHGGGAFATVTNLRLSDGAIGNITLKKAAEMETELRKYFHNYDDAPADAQLGLMSIAWACGGAFAPRWPLFSAAFRSSDWATCADQCELSTVGNPGVAPRNRACRALFLSAAAGGDPDEVNGWPQTPEAA